MDRQRLEAFLAPTRYNAAATLLSVFSATAWMLRNTYSLGGGRAYAVPGDVTWAVVSVLLLWPVTLTEYLIAHTALGESLMVVAVIANVAYLYVLSTVLVRGIRRYRA